MAEVRTMEIRLYPNRSQERILNETLGHCCFLYNHLLEGCRNAYAEGIRVPSAFDMNKEITAFKREHPELKEVYSQVLLDVAARVDNAFKGFFAKLKAREHAGFPRFRSGSRYDSFTYTQKGFRMVNGKLRLSKIDDIRTAGFRKGWGEPKTCIITREGCAPRYRWKACLTYTYEEISTLGFEDMRTPVGVDLGLKDVMVVSDGTRYPNHRHLRDAEKKVAAINRRMSSLEKDSVGYMKERRKLYHAFVRLNNVRKAERYDIVNDLVSNHDVIVVEDIDVSGIQDKSLGKGMRKSYRDASWGKLIGTLCTKAAEAGCTVVKVGPEYTSQRCSRCGRTVPKDLSERRHVCVCGLDIDRDLNAARNIRRLGLQALRWENREMERSPPGPITALGSL